MARYKGSTYGHRLARRMIPLHGRSCELCGATDDLTRHHVDGDPYHNDPTNVQCLCRSCHGALHAREYWTSVREEAKA